MRLRFDAFTLDSESGELRKGERAVKLKPQPFKVLFMLASRSGRVVTREDIQNELWANDAFVDFDLGINSCIRQIRIALEDDADEPRYVATLPRKGYRFLQPVERDDETEAAAAPAAAVRWVWTAAAVLIGLAIVAIFERFFEGGAENAAGVVRLAVPLPPTERLSPGHPVSLSPDGTLLAYTATREDGRRLLYVRALDQSDARPLEGTEQAMSPFFSPDGRWLGFVTGGKLKKVASTGGPVTILGVGVGRGSWGEDDTILIPSVPGEGLARVASSGRARGLLTSLRRGELGHRDPQHLPGGHAVLFTVVGDDVSKSRVAVLSLETGERHDLVHGSRARYAPTGHLIFHRENSVYAAPFDAEELTLDGEPRLLFDERMALDVSRNGTLAYGPLLARVVETHRVVWVNREGATEALPLPERRYGWPRLSPDGTSLALTVLADRGGDVWRLDLESNVFSRVTDDGRSGLAVWTADGRRLVYVKRAHEMFWQEADGGSDAERLLPETQTHSQYATSSSPDGESAVFVQADPVTMRDVHLLRLADGRTEPLLKSEHYEAAAVFSPDGRWLAYDSDESGRREVYVRSFPGLDGRKQISTDGGMAPVWSRDGAELFYRAGDKMMAVAVETQAGFRSGKPKVLFERPYEMSEIPEARAANYDVSSDGRFVMIRREKESYLQEITVVLNWHQEFRSLAPPDE